MLSYGRGATISGTREAPRPSESEVESEARDNAMNSSRAAVAPRIFVVDDRPENVTAILAAETQRHALQLAQIELIAKQHKTEALEEAVQMRDEFLALASHELNTPLSPLLTSIQMLLRSAKTSHCRPATVDALEVALRQIERLRRLVSELLDVTRIESGQLALSLEEVDMVDVVRQTIEAQASNAAREGTQVRFTEHAPAKGHWDRTRLEQITTNLLTNAIKFSARRPIEISVDQSDARTRLVVRDHGVGIDADQIERIFERYGRAQSAQHYGGLGLGLYIVRRVVEAHGGTIGAESVPGEGKTFTVDLPAHAVATG
jgi:signal transduction histidine kinase